MRTKNISNNIAVNRLIIMRKESHSRI